MSVLTTELIHQVLKRLQDRQSDTKAQLNELREELRALRGHVRAIQTDIANLYAAQAVLATRLEHIEPEGGLGDAGRPS